MANIFEAIAAGDLDAVREIVRREPASASARDDQGRSGILNALYRGQEDMVAVLRQARTELDVFEAAAVGDTERVLCLLDADPSVVNAWSVDGFTPLHLAVFFGHPDTAKLLLERSADPAAVSRNRMAVMPLHSAVAGRHLRTVEIILDAGADVNAPSHAGFTPLLDAAQNGDRRIVELLLAKGADPELATDAGKRAQDLALQAGHQDVADLLEERS